MNTKRIQLVLLSATLAGILLWLFWLVKQSKSHLASGESLSLRSPNTEEAMLTSAASQPSSFTTPPDQRESERKTWDIGLATPIRFYGKVVDETGNPVEGAKAHISLADHIWEGNSKIERMSDANGLFSVSGHGLGLSVMVSKEGYYHVAQSDGAFGYAKGAGSGTPHPNTNSPAIFVLRKRGNAEPLIRFERDFPISKNGAPVDVNLMTGKVDQIDLHDFKIEAWTNDQGHQINSNQPYDWRCRVTVPGGGVIRRGDEFDFEAPLDGYLQSDEVEMLANLGAQWRSQALRSYFVRLADGTYARVEFRMIAGGHHFFTIKSYLNPTPGDRNLEFDPAKEIKPR